MRTIKLLLFIDVALLISVLFIIGGLGAASLFHSAAYQVMSFFLVAVFYSNIIAKYIITYYPFPEQL